MDLPKEIFPILFACGIMFQNFTPSPAFGADISYRSEGRFRGIYIEGDIKAGDYERFHSAWLGAGDSAGLWGVDVLARPDTKQSLSGLIQPIDVYLISNGGDAREAFKIGRFIRRVGLRAIAPTRIVQGSLTVTNIADRAGNELLCVSACAFARSRRKASKTKSSQSVCRASW